MQQATSRLAHSTSTVALSVKERMFVPLLRRNAEVNVYKLEKKTV